MITLKNAPIQTLNHCYDDIRDVIAVPKSEFRCSEVYKRSNPNFGLVIVYPSSKLKLELAVYGDAISGQYSSKNYVPWPGRKPPFNWRVNMDNIRFTTMARIKQALFYGNGFNGHATVFTTTVIESILKPSPEELQEAMEQARCHILKNL